MFFTLDFIVLYCALFSQLVLSLASYGLCFFWLVILESCHSVQCLWSEPCRFWTNIKCLMILVQEKVLRFLGVCRKVWYWLVIQWEVLLLGLLLYILILGNQQLKLFLHFQLHISRFLFSYYCFSMCYLNVWWDTCILFRSPPVALQPSLGHYFARVNSKWREGYKVQTTNTGRYVSDPVLSNVVVVSISGAYNDYQVLSMVFTSPPICSRFITNKWYLIEKADLVCLHFRRLFALCFGKI